jgi:ribosomal protein S27E
MTENLVKNKIEYTKVYCSSCLDGEVVYRKKHNGYYCTNSQCIYYSNKINIREE